VLLALVSLSPKGRSVSEGELGATASAQPSLRSKPDVPAEAKSARPVESPPAQPSGTANEGQKRSQNAELEAEARAEQREAEVTARISELRDLSRKTDPGSWETVLSEIKNPDPTIRRAAIDIISQSGNRGVIPRLSEAAAQTEDAAEKQVIADAIEFLSLPTLTEVLSQTEQKSSNSGSGGNTKSGVIKPPPTRKP
jgi:hypothetical protein